MGFLAVKIYTMKDESSKSIVLIYPSFNSHRLLLIADYSYMIPILNKAGRGQ